MTPKQYFKEMCNYDLISTFWNDFSIAEHFGINAVKRTYEEAFEGYKNDYKMITELTLILNHKIWQLYKKDEALARVYNDLWQKCDNWCCENLEGEELNYFYRVLD